MTKHTTVITSDVPIEVNVKNDRWFKMFHAIVEYGYWTKLSLSASKVYVILAKFSDGDWCSWPSVSTIQGWAGISRRSVYRAIEELEKLGLLVLRVSGGGRKCNTYQLLPPLRPDNLFTRVESAKCLTRETPPVSPVRPHPSHQRDPNKTYRERLIAVAEEKQEKPAAAEIENYLISLGVGEPVRSEFVNSGLSLSKIRHVAARWRKSGRSVACLVLDLRQAVEQLPLIEASKARLATQKQKSDPVQSVELQRSEILAARDEILSRFYSLEEQEQQSLLQNARESLTLLELRAVGNKTLNESPTLCRAISKLL